MAKDMEAIQIDLQELCRRAGSFPPEAFIFVQEGLRHTVERLQRDDPGMEETDRHVSGRELCIGLRDYALRQYGMLAGAVLGHWRVRRTEDFGRIVFTLVDAGLMRKREEDSVDDFRDVFDFEEAFSPASIPARHG